MHKVTKGECLGKVTNVFKVKINNNSDYSQEKPRTNFL